MRPTLRQLLLGIAFLIVYGALVFAATRAYYLQPAAARAPGSAAPARAQAPRPPQAQVRPSAPAEPLADDPLALGEQADRLFTEQRFDAAALAYRKLLGLRPDDPQVHNDLGLSLHYLGRGPEALQVLEQGALKGPGFQRIWLTLGFVRFRLGQQAAAREALERALSLGAETPIGLEAQRFLGQLQ
ncbi:MAG TPA: tetratricopeptide repeat protein [Gammaproteobacteria bacterium]